MHASHMYAGRRYLVIAIVATLLLAAATVVVGLLTGTWVPIALNMALAWFVIVPFALWAWWSGRDARQDPSSRKQ